MSNNLRKAQVKLLKTEKKIAELRDSRLSKNEKRAALIACVGALAAPAAVAANAVRSSFPLESVEKLAATAKIPDLNEAYHQTMALMTNVHEGIRVMVVDNGLGDYLINGGHPK
ncbi:MAG: hypothetical protein AAGB02_03030 [Pseudomonadota bacterium]